MERIRNLFSNIFKSKIKTLIFWFVIIFLFFGIPMLIEYFIKIPSGKHGDWLNFWGQYLGTWIALIGSIIITLIITTLEIRSNRKIEMHMLKVQERTKVIFEIIDIISDLIFETEYPIFRKVNFEELDPEDWLELIYQFNSFQNNLKKIGPQIIKYEYRVPSDFVETVLDFMSENGETYNKFKNISNQMENFNELVKIQLLPNNIKNSNEKNFINKKMVEINKSVQELRINLIEVCRKSQKYIDTLEQMN